MELLEIYVLATFKVMSGHILIVRTHGDFLVPPLGNQADGTMTTQTHYPDTDISWQGSDTNRFLSILFDSTRI